MPVQPHRRLAQGKRTTILQRCERHCGTVPLGQLDSTVKGMPRYERHDKDTVVHVLRWAINPWRGIMLYFGIDWSENHHNLCIQSEAGANSIEPGHLSLWCIR